MTEKHCVLFVLHSSVSYELSKKLAWEQNFVKKMKRYGFNAVSLWQNGKYGGV